jgi:hypothetical protein
VQIAVVYQRNAKRVVQLRSAQIAFWRSAVVGPVIRNTAIIIQPLAHRVSYYITVAFELKGRRSGILLKTLSEFFLC